MRRLRVALAGILLGALAILPATVAVGREVIMVATGTLELTWQGAAGRTASRFVIVRVRDLSAESGGLLGFLGLRRPPGMAGYMPEPHVLEGEVAGGDMAGHAVRLRLPGGETRGVTAGDVVALGLVDATHCICVLRVPAGITVEGAAAWATGQACR